MKYLCKQIAKDEWSGVLFYSVEGSIKKPSKMVITLEDIHLMDIGSPGFTSFNWDETIVEYLIDHPEAEDWKIGHIHSHNTMSVFFSGTDWDELNDNSPLHNLYLSVIVNNYMDLTAKIASVITPKIFTAKDSDGVDYKIDLSAFQLDQCMIVYDCEFIGDVNTVIVDDEFSKRYEKVREEKNNRPASSYTPTNPAVTGANKQASQQGGKLLPAPIGFKQEFPEWENNRGQLYEKFKEEEKLQRPFQEITEKKEEGVWSDTIDAEDGPAETLEEGFAAYILRMGNLDNDDNIVNACEDIEIANLNPIFLSKTITENYNTYYENFFDTTSEMYAGDKGFLNVLEEVINILTPLEFTYPFLEAIIADLKIMGNRLEVQQIENKMVLKND